jgi:hypothetical protein
MINSFYTKVRNFARAWIVEGYTLEHNKMFRVWYVGYSGVLYICVSDSTGPELEHVTQRV